MKPRGKWIIGILLFGLAAGVGFDLVRGMGMKTSLEVRAEDLKGRQWSLSANQGHPVLLSFFSTSCGPCRMEFPAFVRFQEQFADRGLQVVYLTQESRDIIQADRDLSTAPITFLVGATDAFADFRVESLPRTLLIGASGEVLKDINGYHPSLVKELEDRIAELPRRSL